MKNNFFKISLLLIIFCGCEKTIKIKTDTVSGLKYVEPKKCEFRKVNIYKYKTKIVDNLLTIDEKNLNFFLKNLNEYKISLEEYILCYKNSDEYYRNIISEIIK